MVICYGYICYMLYNRMAVDPILDEIILFLFISDISLMQNAKAI